MLRIDQLHDYQKRIVTHQCSHQQSMLWVQTGLGKTISTLTSVAHLLQTGYLRGVLIVAPIRVVKLVWAQESQKWSHTKHLTFSKLTGDKDMRSRALMKSANVYLVNPENLEWLAETVDKYFIKAGKPLPFDGVVFDEISKFKNSATKRVRSYKKIAPHMKWTTGLTGTPASNGYKDLHGQYLVVDLGKRLGTSKTSFRQRFYRKVGPYTEIAYDDTEEKIKALVGDITLEMSADEYLKMPDLIVNDIFVDLPAKVRSKYDQLEKEFFIAFESGAEAEVFNRASLTNKLLQFSNGAVYPEPGDPHWEHVHDEKLDALDDIIEAAQGSPVLLAYSYRSDADRIMERYKHLDPINITALKSDKALNDAMDKWKRGDCQLMIGHPACLHPSTKVLTEWRGWVKIIDVLPTERVHDGIEFVTHEGCSYSGYKEVIDVFGITMTPDHKLLIDNEWVEGKNVQDSEELRKRAIFEWQSSDDGDSRMFRVWENSRTGETERREKQPRKKDALRILHSGNIPQNDQHEDLGDLARNEKQSEGRNRQKLRWSWNKVVSRVGRIFEFLQRHVGDLFGSSDHRTNRREWSVLQGELQMDYDDGAAIEQKKQSTCKLQRGRNASCRVSKSIRIQQDDVNNEIKPGYDSQRGRGGLQDVRLRKESGIIKREKERKAHVYDLVNCGPRNRFLIRNDNGDIFISHNSMGHGIDGLQTKGNIVVWYGLNWSLELFDQMNARLHRQGQGSPVIAHRIMSRDTMDEAVALALDAKATNQESLKKAIRDYAKKRLTQADPLGTISL